MVPLKGYEERYCIERDGRVWSNRTNKYLKTNKGGGVILTCSDKRKHRYKVRYLVDCQFTPGYLESLGVPLKGYEELYRINEQGQVWSCFYKIYVKVPKNKAGYLVAALRKDGVTKLHTLHRLLALQFIPNPTCRPLADHINKVRLDNRLENLRWVTSAENNQNRGMSTRNTSGHIGVGWMERYKKWRASIMAYGISHSKTFVLLEDAIAHRAWLVETYHKFGLSIE